MWGHENREAALRFITGMAGGRCDTANMEFKAADCAGHPYLLPGAVIAAGLDGIERGLTLPEPCLGRSGVAHARRSGRPPDTSSCPPA